MASYRTLHRHELTETAWRVAIRASDKNEHRVWTPQSAWNVSPGQDAAALALVEDSIEPTTKKNDGFVLVSVERNYAGEDRMDGDWLVATMDLHGRVRVNDQSFTVLDATGTTLALCPPRVFLHRQTSVMAIGMLDGSVQICTTGISVTGEAVAAGTVVQSLPAHPSVPLSLAWNPDQAKLAVARFDGTVQIWNVSNGGGSTLLHQLHPEPCRGLAWLDNNVLVAGNDAGTVCLWEGPRLMRHVFVKSWVLQILALDARRFVTLERNGSVHVWQLGELDQPVHSFQCPDAFAMAADEGLLVVTTTTNVLQFYSLKL